ncbi:MAG: two-component sensor histidine kinase [Lachnospiraceae bacterium]|jgi:signal transduction histidine kinase|nr:two-component sensor histidine kinase [Lachnospiraceae bacterium]
MFYRWEDLKSKIKSLRSLKTRIFILIFLVGLIPGYCMQYGILQNYEIRAISVRSSEVQAQLKILANHLITYNYLQDTSSPVINAELEQLSNLYGGRVLIISGNLKVVKDTYGISEGKTIISEEVVKCFRGESMSNYDADLGYIEMTIPISEKVGSAAKDGGTEEVKEVVRGVMLIGISCDTIHKTMDILSNKANILLLIMMIIILGFALLLSNFMVNPLNRVTMAINEVTEGFSDKAINVPDYAETVHIIDAFNQLLGRMKVIDDTRQEFVSNVSHELKTPITSMKVLADSLLSQENVPVELYREFMEDIAKEIDRENKIITDLLSLVKMDKKVTNMNITEVNMNELTEVILKRLRPIARKRDIEVTFESIRQVKATVDEVKISLVISNLVENAVKYNKENGWVKVVLDADHQFFTLAISDSGIGIPAEEISHIYERFYRVDKSHSREIGGTGLGLAITRSAVLMHRGSVRVESSPGEGTSFMVKIPLNYKA